MPNNWEQLASVAKEESARALSAIHEENGCLAGFDSATRSLLEAIQGNEVSEKGRASDTGEPILTTILKRFGDMFEPPTFSKDATPEVKTQPVSRRKSHSSRKSSSFKSLAKDQVIVSRLKSSGGGSINLVQKLVDNEVYDDASKILLSIYLPSVFWEEPESKRDQGRCDDLSLRTRSLTASSVPSISNNQILEELQVKLKSHVVSEMKANSFPSAKRDQQRPQSSLDRDSNSWYQKKALDPYPPALTTITLMWHLSGGRDEAWESIIECFRDGKVNEINPKDYVIWNHEREADRPKRQNVSRVSSLHKEMGHGLRDGVNTSSPQTYLQLIGHILLKNLAHQLPLLLSLPENAPVNALRDLYIAPFIHALKKAISAVFQDSCVHPSAFITHVLSRPEDRTFQPIYLPPGTNSDATSRLGVSKSMSGGSIVGVVSNIYSDALEYIQGVHLMFGQFQTSMPRSFVETFEKEMSSLWETFRERGGTSIHAYIVESVQRLVLEGAQNMDHASVGMFVLRDSWPGTGMKHMGNEIGEIERPKMLAEYMHQVLSFITMNLHRLHRIPVTFQAPFSIGALDAMRAFLDDLSLMRTPIQQFEGSKKLLLAVSGALCARRHLYLFQRAFDITRKDKVFFHFVHVLGACLTQADEVIHNLKKSVVSVHCELFAAHIFSGLYTCDWKSYRPALKHKRDTGPAVRLWRGHLVMLLNDLFQICSFTVAQDLFSQILVQTTCALAQRYMQVTPSRQWLDRFLADVSLIIMTAHSFSVPFRMEVKSMDLEAIDHVQTEDICVSIKEHLALQLANTCQELCTRAGLLVCPARRFEEIGHGASNQGEEGDSMQEDPWRWGRDLFLQWSSHFVLPQGGLPQKIFSTGVIFVDEFKTFFMAFCTQLASTASAGEVESALAQRWELQEAVEGLELTKSEEEARELIQELARGLEDIDPDLLPAQSHSVHSRV